jgi:hypothetical protein
MSMHRTPQTFAAGLAEGRPRRPAGKGITGLVLAWVAAATSPLAAITGGTMRRIGRKLSAVLAVVATALLVGGVSTSDAQVSGQAGVSVKLSAHIEGPLSGDEQPLDAAGNLLCTAGQKVGGGATDAQKAACAIPALDYQFVTRFRRANGTEIVRRHTAVLNVPAALDVDEDLSPDLVGTLGIDPLTLSPAVSLEIDRAQLETSKLPVKVEAIVDDPTAGGLPRERINAGYDARDGCPSGLCAPSDWKATARFSSAGGSTVLDVQQDMRDQLGATPVLPASIKLLGGLFDGDALARKNPMGGELQYSPIPMMASLGATLGQCSGTPCMEVRAGATKQTKVNARAEIVDGPRTQLLDGTIDRLPASLATPLALRMEEPEGQRRVTYTASAGVDSLTATYTDTLEGTLATKVVAKASKLPKHMVLHQTSARAGTFAAGPGETLGHVEVGYANGEPKLLAVDHPYARVFDDGTLQSYAGRIDELQSASFDATSKVTGELVLGPDERKKFRALVELPAGRHIDGVVSNLARHTKVVYDADGGTVDYDGFGETIDEIVLNAQQDAPFFGRVKKIRGRVASLPPAVSIGFKPAVGSGVTFSATPAVGMIEGALTDGVAAEPTLAPGASGVVMRDIPSEFSLIGRVFNVTSASMTTSGPNLDATLNTGPLADGSLQDVALDVTFDTPNDAVTQPARIVGFVEDLPASLTLNQHGSTTIYDASSIVPRMTIDARNLPGGAPGGTLDGGLHNAVGTLTGVPRHFEISAGTDAGIQVTNGAFTRIDLEAWDHGPQNAPFAEDGRNKVGLDRRDGRLHLQARVFALSKLLLATAGTTKVETAFGSAPAPLDIAVDGGTGGEPLDLDVAVTDLPTSSTFTLSQLLGLKIGWDAGSSGTDVTLKLSAKEVGADLTLTDLPSFVDVCVGGGPIACQPKAPQAFQRGAEVLLLPNSFTAVTNANGTIRMSGKVCLPPTDADGEALDPPGTVYGACLDGTSPNRIEITNLRLSQQRLELGAGDTTNKDQDGDPVEDDLLKLWLEGSSDGIRVDQLFVRNDTADTSTIIKAGTTGGLPLRNSGDHFFLLADMSGVPNTEIRHNQMECADLEVKVDLPILGLTDVLPFPGEAFLGDICIDH